MARNESNPDVNEPEPYIVNCPLCEHGVRVAPRTPDNCEFCGAELEVFSDETGTNQFAETCKSRGESSAWRQVKNGSVFVVGHKASPSQEVFRRAG